jgi:phosphoglycolate phosphatase
MDTANEHITTIFFDFDYTLADSSRGVLSCNNYALTQLGFPKTSYPESCKTIGLSLKETYATLTAEPPENGERFVRLFIERAEEVMADMTVLFDETPGMVKALKADGYNLGIVSTKFRYRIETILRREKLFHFFNTIVGGEDVRAHKPNPESLQLALDKLEVSARNSIYVGDSVVDAKTAQNLGISFIAVLSGVTLGEAFKEFPTVQVLSSAKDLPGWISHGKYNMDANQQ